MAKRQRLVKAAHNRHIEHDREFIGAALLDGVENPRRPMLACGML
jgi:hypothetical protein